MEGNKMKVINTARIKEKPLIELSKFNLPKEIILMDEFTWKEILKWAKECEKEQLKFLF
jgi:hypothetical protein